MSSRHPLVRRLLRDLAPRVAGGRAGAAARPAPRQPDCGSLPAEPALRQPREGRPIARRRPRARRARPEPAWPTAMPGRRDCCSAFWTRAASRSWSSIPKGPTPWTRPFARRCARGPSFVSWGSRRRPPPIARARFEASFGRLGGAFLVRPDGYVGFVGGKRAAGEHLDAYCRRWLTAHPSAQAPERRAA